MEARMLTSGTDSLGRVAAFEPGERFAGHRIEGVAGRGGIGVVYRAIQIDLDRPVALKVIAPHLAQDEAFRERFVAESRTAARSTTRTSCPGAPRAWIAPRAPRWLGRARHGRRARSFASTQ